MAAFSKDYDGESVMGDATIVRAHPCAAGYARGQHDREALGWSKDGFTTKIHVIVDALGQALRFTLAPGQRHDITQAPKLLEGFENTNIIADKGYDSQALIAQIHRQNCTCAFLPVQIERHHALMMSLFIRKGIWSNASLTKSNILGESFPGLIKRRHPLWNS